MYRLNVAAAQYDECIRYGLFALEDEPRIPPGEILLLQLNKTDWRSRGDDSGRIRHALVFQSAERDTDGSLSTRHWPNAGKVWQWILHASAVLSATPFSLEDLPLDRESKYQAQRNLVRIEQADEARILPFLQWDTALPITSPEQLPLGIDNQDVEYFAVLQARNALTEWFPEAQVEVMPHNNPGFDLLVRAAGQILRFVEVKGTTKPSPIFMMTETERRFSAENSALYTVAMVWNIDLATGNFVLSRHDGEVVVGSILQPIQYVGQFSGP